jgi:SagB-type dehydrogenase family enzyme
VFALVGAVEGIAAGLYQYVPAGHSLLRRKNGDLRTELSRLALGQNWVREAPVVLVIAARYGRTTRRYGERGIRYVHIEVGHVGQNVHLQAEALGLGAVVVGAFSDEGVKRLLEIAEDPVILMPLGKPR